MKYITVAPTWEGLLPMLIELSRKATTAEARKTAMDELVRMARIADMAVEEAKAREAEKARIDEMALDAEVEGY